MEQNKYDDPEFFANYSKMPRSVGGLDTATEGPTYGSRSRLQRNTPTHCVKCVLHGTEVKEGDLNQFVLVLNLLALRMMFVARQEISCHS